MLDQRQLRNRVLLNLCTSPWILTPLVLGATMLAGAVAVSQKLGLLAFGGFALCLAALGTAVTRFFVGAEGLTERAAKQLKEETERANAQRLDSLDQRLVRDGDVRTEAALRDLRAFQQAFKQPGLWTGRLNATSSFDILSSVQDLFEGCVHALEASLALWETAQPLRIAGARRPILERREELVQDVQQSIEQLSRILVGLQALGSKAADDTDLSRIRSDLDANLKIARRVEEKLRHWEHDVDNLELTGESR
jgi:hypothetical protein